MKYPLRTITFLIFMLWTTFAEAQTTYRFGDQAFNTRGEAEAAMRAAYGDIGPWLEPLRDVQDGDTVTHFFSVKTQEIRTENFAWQQFSGDPTSGASSCSFAGYPLLPSTENLCNSAEEYTDKQETIFEFRNCNFPPSDVHVVPTQFQHGLGGIIDTTPIKAHLATELRIPAERIGGVTNLLGLYQSYWTGADCDVPFVLQPTQDCIPDTTCSPGPSITEHLVGVCPPGLIPLNISFFRPENPTNYPRFCSQIVLTSITDELSPSATDLPTAQSNDPCEGNPCNVVSGDKYLRELLFETAGLSFELLYHSLVELPGDSLLGRGWSHGFSSSITDANAVGSEKILLHPNATTTTFAVDQTNPGTFYSLLGGDSLIRQISGDELHYLPGDDKKFVYTKRDSGNRHYLSAITDLSQGSTIHIKRNTNGIIKSVDIDGARALIFAYDQDTGNRLVSVSQGGVALATFSYTGVTPISNRLDSVRFADGAVRTYSYGDSRFPFHVTGITDENNDPFSTYEYHPDGKVQRSQRAGGAGLVELEYFPGETTVAMPLGAEKVYELSRPPGSLLTRLDRVTEDGLVVERSYNGTRPWIPASSIDRNGNQTQYQYDSWNRVRQMTRGASTPEAVTVETDWNDAFNRPAQIRHRDSAGVVSRQTDFSYSEGGQLLSVTEMDPTVPGSNRTTTYSYYSVPEILVGRLRIIDGPRSIPDMTTFTYRVDDDPNGGFRAGDLHTVTNAAGHVTEYLEYDSAGRALRVEDPNGVVTSLGYHLRGWLTSSSTGGEVIRYAYDNVGNLIRVTQPDGSFLRNDYDQAHRLIRITDALDNSQAFTLDAAGNRITEENRDPAGILRRSQGRVYDRLGRLRQLLSMATQISPLPDS